MKTKLKLLSSILLLLPFFLTSCDSSIKEEELYNEIENRVEISFWNQAISGNQYQYPDRAFVYDGKEHTSEIVGKLLDGTTVQYKNNKLTTVTTLHASATFEVEEGNTPIAPLTATLRVVRTVEELLTFVPDVNGTYAVSACDKTAAGEIIIPSTYLGKPVHRIAEHAFENCKNITSIVLPEGIDRIKDYAFKNCYDLKSIHFPDSLNLIGEEAFWGCEDLLSLSIPKNVKSIGVNAFACTSRLEKIKVDEENLYYDSRNGSNALIETANDKIIVGSISSIIPEGIKAIGKNAFRYSFIRNIALPSTVTELEYDSLYDERTRRTFKVSPFMGCPYIETIQVAKENPVYDSRKDSNLLIFTKNDEVILGARKVSIPKGIVSIAPFAFYNRICLRDIRLPKGFKDTGAYAFANCLYLKLFSVPAHMQLIDAYCFYYCKSLNEIYVRTNYFHFAEMLRLDATCFYESAVKKINCRDRDVKI